MFAARKEPAVKRQIAIARADRQNDPVTQSEVHPCAVVKREVIGTRRFEALIISVAAKVRGTEFEVAENFVAAPRIERIVTPIVAKFSNDRADSGVSQAFGCDPGLCIRGGEDLILIPDTQVSGS